MRDSKGKIYVGYRVQQIAHDGTVTSRECKVEVRINACHFPLDPCFKKRKHSPTGFEWGYCGSGPAQLALALVADACGAEFARPEIYQRVKAIIVGGLPSDGWTLTAKQVQECVMQIVAQKEGGVQ